MNLGAAFFDVAVANSFNVAIGADWCVNRSIGIKRE
jgi:hypothetical protein